MQNRIKNGSLEPLNGSKLPIERKLSVAAKILALLASLVKLLEVAGLL